MRTESNLVVGMYQGGKGEELLSTMCDIDTRQRNRYCTKDLNLTNTALKRRRRNESQGSQNNRAGATILSDKTVSAASFRAHQSHQRERHILRQGIRPGHFLVSSQSLNDCLRRPRYPRLHCRQRARRSTIPTKYLTELELWSIRRAKGWVQSDWTVPSAASRQTMMRAIRRPPLTWEPWLAQ